MSTQTTNFLLTLPAVLSPVDANVWGPEINGNTTTTDNVFLNLDSCNIGTTPPFIPGTGVPTPGQLWLNNTASNNWPLSIYDGANWVSIGSLDPITHTFTGVGAGVNYIPIGTSMTYTPSVGIRYIIVEVMGGGGGGGGTTGAGSGYSVSGGGGAGAYSKTALDAATVGSSQVVTIGTGGTGGASGGANGNAGSVTSFGTLCSALGGSGGFGAPNTTNNGTVTALGGNGGAGGIGTIHANGAPGGYGITFQLFGSAAGNGGATMWGSAIAAPAGATITSGYNANGFGAGGTGAISSTTGFAGGNGSPGFCIITEYF
jgi:hypothetical protein